jgi:hypothetical protein
VAAEEVCTGLRRRAKPTSPKAAAPDVFSLDRLGDATHKAHVAAAIKHKVGSIKHKGNIG